MMFLNGLIVFQEILKISEKMSETGFNYEIFNFNDQEKPNAGKVIQQISFYLQINLLIFLFFL